MRPTARRRAARADAAAAFQRDHHDSRQLTDALARVQAAQLFGAAAVCAAEPRFTTRAGRGVGLKLPAAAVGLTIAGFDHAEVDRRQA